MPTNITPSTEHLVSSSLQRIAKLKWLGGKLIPVGLFLTAGIVLVVIVGIAQRIGWLRAVEEPSAVAANVVGATFTCPMHPQIRQPIAGRCPICGMPLVPAASAAADLNEFSVKISPAQRRLANIQTAPAVVSSLQATLQTIGAIAIDESRQATIASYIDGRLERLFADYTGMEIAKGDHLAVIYSPQLHAAQVEYLEAKQATSVVGGLPAVREAQAALAGNTRQRLREFGMTEEQLLELERTRQAQSRLTIYAPQGGTVVEKLVVEGNYVKAGEPIYRIAQLSTVWLMLKLFPEDASRIRFGQRVEATVQALPGHSLVGRVAFIDPTVDAKTRTVSVRVELLNEQGRLRPGDYAQARITLPIGPQGEVYDADLAGKWISPMHPQIIRNEPGPCPICGMNLVPTSKYGFSQKPVPPPESLHVPRSAVLLAGGNSVVYVEKQPGEFELRPVTLGSILRDKVVILQGVNAGELVATAGNFLIDSQMQLAGKPSLIDPTRALVKKSDNQGPLALEPNMAKSIAGTTGVKLEKLYATYLELQQNLASDKPPSSPASQSLHQVAVELSSDMILSVELQQLAQTIATKAEHLPHRKLSEARQDFRVISQAVIKLTASLRGENAQHPFTHFYCSMVPGGGGNWLQASGELRNPYFGREMLHCGEKVREFTLPKSPAVVAPVDKGGP